MGVCHVTCGALFFFSDYILVELLLSDDIMSRAKKPIRRFSPRRANLHAGLARGPAIDLLRISDREGDGEGKARVRNKALDSRCIGCKRQELSCKKPTQPPPIR